MIRLSVEGWFKGKRTSFNKGDPGDMHKQLRIFIGLTEISGYYANLTKGFREHGLPCTYVCLGEHRFGYGGADNHLRLVRWIKFFGKRRARTSRSRVVRKLFWVACYEAVNLMFFIWAAFRHDVFIFGFSSSFFKSLHLPFWDLAVLKFVGKRVICVFHGSDSRPAYLNAKFLKAPSNARVEDAAIYARKQRKSVHRIENFSDLIVCAPPWAYFLQHPYACVIAIGHPFESGVSKSSPARPSRGNQVRILHAPSDPEIKGTRVIREIIERLRQNGHSIEFVEMIGKTNAQVIEDVKQCDFIVDQLYGNLPMAGFATEAAFFGKPAVVGGYYSRIVRDDVPDELMPPSEYCLPEELESAIERLIIDRDYRLELGRAAAAFVRRHMSPRKVAERYLRLIDGTAPKEWYLDPQQIRYLHGHGMQEKRVKAVVKSVIEYGGVKALQLRDKPELERLFRAFAYGEEERSGKIDARTQ